VAQPPEIEALAAQLADTYRVAWDQIEAELATIASDPAKWRRAARLRELEASIAELMGAVDAQARDWLERTFPQVYSLGAGQAADALGATFAWTTPHRDAVSQLAQETFDDLLAATSHVNIRTKQLVRELSRTKVISQVVGGRSAKEATAALKNTLESKGVWAVTYKDGSRHGLGEYADVVIRTRSAIVFSAGTINHSATNGVEFMECFDGTGCGLRSHEGSPKANGLIVSVQRAAEFPVSHPRCRRSWGPRPDITSEDQAGEASPSTTESQRADQGEFERRRAATIRRRAAAR
jgi:hypothetical protein